MQINFHIVLEKSFLEKISDLQKVCKDLGFDVSFDSASLKQNLSRQKTLLNVEYRNKITSAEVCLATISDVKGVCDDIWSHLSEEHDSAININFNGNDLAAIYIVIAVLTKMSNGILYVEQDGVILRGDEAIKNAKAWDNVK
ncbi:MAG: hypothetical protein WAQ98_19010 [Blastocatellia bacterium]